MTLTPEPYVRIWKDLGAEVALLLADDYRRIMQERQSLYDRSVKLEAANKLLRAELGIH